MGSLERYHRKRDPGATPEPFGDERLQRILPPGASREFVVQQHAARNMHWDLRLEIDGVLVSWAVPKGPTLDASQRRLAVQTEDHPIEYAAFEGVIPEGNYGAGAMIVWDNGSFRTADGVSPAEGLRAGKLDLWMNGLKLRGRFALVRTQAGEGRHWLLLHKSRIEAEPDELIDAHPESVLSGLTIRELAEGQRCDDAVNDAIAVGASRPAPPFDSLKPMLAASAEQAFSRDGWLFELKYDGMRVLVDKRGDAVRLQSRTGRDATHSFPEIAASARHLPLESCVLDGEIAALDETGRTSFESLQRRFGKSDPEVVARLRFEVPTVMYAFDLLCADGRDLRARTTLERKEMLAAFIPREGRIRLADHVAGEGEALFAMAEEHEMEGVIAKRADARYESGRRSQSWLKIKVPRRAELAIVGYAQGRGSRGPIGSLLLAWNADGEFRYAGSVGSGIDGPAADALIPQLEAARRDSAACTRTPGSPARATTYVEPELVCEVSYTEITGAGSLRHPVFHGLVEDRDPLACVSPAAREEVPEGPATAAPAEPGLQLSNLDKVFWREEGYTKGDLLDYYEAVWPWLEPYLRDRPVVLTRYPDGIAGKFFYQKNAPEFTPSWVQRENIEGTDYFICNDCQTLLYVINSGAIPLHVWGARRGALDRPDWLILDLDPKQAPFSRVVTIARHIHALLRDLDVDHYVKTSGQSGLHVLLPVAGQLDHEQNRALAEVLARTVCADLPEIATVVRPVAARGDKVYVDFGQNGRGRLIASPLSVRPVAGATVSAPLRWSQVTQRLNPSNWTLKTTPGKLARSGDPLLGVMNDPVDVQALLAALVERLAAVD
jgi:bifunctional non-homologous end joining protein LigD